MAPATQVPSRIRTRLEPAAGELQRGLGLDPATILLIIQAIMTAIKLIQQCRAKEGKRWHAIRKSALVPAGRRRLRRAVEREIGEAGLERLGGDEFLEALAIKGSEYYAADIDDLAAELGL